jgi:hypothetical protein
MIKENKMWFGENKVEVEPNNRPPTVFESVWWSLAATLTAWSLLAVGIAQLSLFQSRALLSVSLIACAVGWAFWRSRSMKARFQRREMLFLLLIIALGLLLFAWPAEHFPQMGDASIYPNTAAKLIHTGGLTYRYNPLNGLPPQQKELFYVPSDEQFPYINIRSYEGLLYGAYYVMNPDQNTIVSSRPPLVIVWMGLFGLLGGARGMLYVTPLFGVASLITTYFLGRRLFDARAGALSVLWLIVSFPQLHFSRTPYAEVVGQFFVLNTLYALITYLQTSQLSYVLFGSAALTAGFAARLDVLLVIPIFILFLALLVLQQDWQGFIIGILSLVPAIGFTLWTVNRPYVGATAELVLIGQLRFLSQMPPYLVIGLGLAGLLGVVVLVRVVCLHSFYHLRVLVCRILSIIVILAVGYALHIRPLTPEYVATPEKVIATHNEELMALAAQYMSYPFFWLAALGMLLLLWQRQIRRDQVLFAFFVVFFGAGFFWKYTTAKVYPVALRRLIPEVLPAFALLGAFALCRLKNRGRRWKWIGMALAGLVAVLLLSLSGRYWFHRGARGAWNFIGRLSDRLPLDAVVIFEPQSEESIVGWFAAPLWSFHQRDALLMNSTDLDSEFLHDAVCLWQNQGRDVYVISQQDPTGWWPGNFIGRKMDEITWSSSIIGQSRRFPPYVWQFAFKFSIFQIEEISCPGD